MNTEKNKILLSICNGKDFTFLFSRATIRQCYAGKEEKIIFVDTVESRISRNIKLSPNIFLNFLNADNAMYIPFHNLKQFTKTGLNLGFYHKQFIGGNESCLDDDDILEFYYDNMTNEFSVCYQESDMYHYTILELSDGTSSELL